MWRSLNLYKIPEFHLFSFFWKHKNLQIWIARVDDTSSIRSHAKSKSKSLKSLFNSFCTAFDACQQSTTFISMFLYRHLWHEIAWNDKSLERQFDCKTFKLCGKLSTMYVNYVRRIITVRFSLVFNWSFLWSHYSKLWIGKLFYHLRKVLCYFIVFDVKCDCDLSNVAMILMDDKVTAKWYLFSFSASLDRQWTTS